MTVKGTNFRQRKTRLTVAYCVAASEADTAVAKGDVAGAAPHRERMRLARIAWQRLDDHLYPKGR